VSATSLAALEARVRALEDVREINGVLFDWHFAATGGFNGVQSHRPEALECLSEDALIAESPDRPGFGPKGLAQIAKHWAYFHGDAGPLPHIFHCSVAEKVIVTGDAATQKSNMLGFFQLRGGKPAVGLSQRNHHFVRTANGWRMSHRDSEGGLTFMAEELHGNLNPLQPLDEREPWKPLPGSLSVLE
jgi:hypothetical protein